MICRSSPLEQLHSDQAWQFESELLKETSEEKRSLMRMLGDTGIGGIGGVKRKGTIKVLGQEK